MRISVVIPTYNRANFLRLAIDSALNQTYPVSEIIVVDDGSTDSTPELIKQYEGKVEYIRIPNSGFASVPRNVGIESASGDYIALLDSDDIWHAKKIKKQVCEAEKNNDALLIYTDYEYIDENGNIIKNKSRIFPNKIENGYIVPTDQYWEDAFCQLVLGYFINTSTALIKSTAFKEYGLFDTELRFCEDRDLWLRLAYAGRVIRVPEVLTYIRSHTDSWSQRHADIYVSQQKKLYSKTLNLVRGNPEKEEFLRKAKLPLRRQWATHMISAAYNGIELPRSKRILLLLNAILYDHKLLWREPHVWKNLIKLIINADSRSR